MQSKKGGERCTATATPKGRARASREGAGGLPPHTQGHTASQCWAARAARLDPTCTTIGPVDVEGELSQSQHWNHIANLIPQKSRPSLLADTPGLPSQSLSPAVGAVSQPTDRRGEKGDGDVGRGALGSCSLCSHHHHHHQPPRRDRHKRVDSHHQPRPPRSVYKCAQDLDHPDDNSMGPEGGRRTPRR